VGLLDIDIPGPSIPAFLNLEGHHVSAKQDSIIPLQVGENLKVMSIGFLLKNTDDAVIGVIENMSGFVCPVCGSKITIFNTDGGEKMAKDMDVPLLGSIPVDPDIVLSGDSGVPHIKQYAESETTKSFQNAIEPILKRLQFFFYFAFLSFIPYINTLIFRVFCT